MIERVTSPEETEGDKQDERFSLRPERLENFTGQDRLVANMKVFIQAAVKRGEPLDHTLLCGPPGLGKTTFAQIIAREMNANLRATSAPVIEKSGDMASILSSLKKGDVFFIDEIHRLKPVIEEVLYSAMEDFSLDIQLGQGMTAKTVKIAIPPFTLVGATTKPGALTRPLMSRFGIVNQFEFYELPHLRTIAKTNAERLGILMDASGVEEIARRSRGTPRILNRILRRVRDFAEVGKAARIDQAVADHALSQMHIDSLGLDAMDRKILHILVKNFGGGPVGVDNLATSLGEDRETIEDIYEPYLIQIGFLKRSPRGRLVTREAYKYLKIEMNPTLFDTAQDPENSPRDL